MTSSGTSSKSQQPRSRTPAEIEAELASTRQRFTATLDELSVRTQPDELGKDLSDIATSAGSDLVSQAKEWSGLSEDSSGLRPELVGALAGAGLAILILLIRSRRSSVAYEFVLPNDQTKVDGIVVRATGRTMPKGIGGRRV